MTEKSKLLSLMARKEKLAFSRAAQEVGRLAREQQQTEAYEQQLKSMMLDAGQGEPRTKAQLTSDHWFGTQIAAQLNEIRSKSEDVQLKMAQAVHHLAHVEARASNYTQKAQNFRLAERARQDERRLTQIIDADI